MVNVRDLEMWNKSLSMLFNKSPKIKYICGKCGSYNETRISLTAIKLNRPHVICGYCGEINNTGIKLT
ncbi:peptidoglycan-binding protein [Clostridium sardiniense]|uniref:Peptidoglycan-binding protein n=1 Tax=Clostridium sardiniense TaxID=29369 RepID=A0ABS7KW79_CLOSR|nr:peptidoglycan-binding protein [Clostridium sardiniense]MBY0755045.1 peptidoglycan-binding protein [Clostridium sardiniense]MDQ0459100.1 ribosomal protein S27AE [Clostridium sardiniense]